MHNQPRLEQVRGMFKGIDGAAGQGVSQAKENKDVPPPEIRHMQTITNQPAQNESPTWPHVFAFALRMEAKLAKNRHKGDRSGWLKDSPHSLWDRIGDESQELFEALEGDNVEAVWNESADVANFAMMVADSFTASREKTKEVYPSTTQPPAQDDFVPAMEKAIDRYFAETPPEKIAADIKDAEGNGLHPLINRGSKSIAAGAAFELFMAWADRPTNAARVTEWMEPFFELAITTALAAQAGEVEKEQARWQDEIYKMLCRVCPEAQIDGGGCDSGDPLDLTISEVAQGLNHWEERFHAAETDRNALRQQLAQVKAELDAAKKLTSEASIKHVIDKNLAR